MHDSKGVKGTHRAGTTPNKSVLDSIPDGVGTVGNLPETQGPGTDEATPQRAPVNVRTGKPFRVDEGVPVIPGGNRDAGPATQRPRLDDVDEQPISRSSSGAVLPEPTPEPVEEATVESTAEEAPQEASETPAEPAEGSLLPPGYSPPEEGAEGPQEPHKPLPTSKRKLIRAKNADLEKWCKFLGIDPEEHIAEDEEVTGDLMRILVGNEQGIDHGLEW